MEIALRRGGDKAANCSSVVPDALKGDGEVKVTFDGKKGRAIDVAVPAPWAGTDAEPCIKRAFVGEIIVPFQGQLEVPYTIHVGPKADAGKGAKDKGAKDKGQEEVADEALSMGLRAPRRRPPRRPAACPRRRHGEGEREDRDAGGGARAALSAPLHALEGARRGGDPRRAAPGASRSAARRSGPGWTRGSSPRSRRSCTRSSPRARRRPRGSRSPSSGPGSRSARLGCGSDQTTCGPATGARVAAYIIDGIVQLGGLALITEGIVMKTESEAPKASAFTLRRGSFEVTPVPVLSPSMSGLGFAGTF